MEESQRRREIMDRLEQHYRDRGPGLVHEDPFQLLVAVILSAQCTDQRVNEVSRRLFRRVSGPADLLDLGPEQLEREIRSCGLFRAKARNLRETCRRLLESHQGEVPASREELERLPGVGRKSASVILSQAFGLPALAVDTHVFRVSRRLGLAAGRTAAQVERELTGLWPAEKWSQAHFWLISHGREVCRALQPQCPACFLADLCPARLEVSGDGSDHGATGSSAGSGVS